ncbi:MAG: hypothetical protein HY965_09715 [Ignavibacteriales bacterium]|nr:hypothetical protein [Ignavibacteriales bacterium]
MDIDSKIKRRMRKDAAKLQATVPLFAEMFAPSEVETREIVIRNQKRKEEFPARFEARMQALSRRASLHCAVYIQILNALAGSENTLIIYQAAISKPRYTQPENLAGHLCTIFAKRLQILPLTVYQFANHVINN